MYDMRRVLVGDIVLGVLANNARVSKHYPSGAEKEKCWRLGEIVTKPP